MIENINRRTTNMTWKEREKKGMAKVYYCKKNHKCYDCKHFVKTYEAWTCQIMPDKYFISLTNYNLKVDDVMSIFEENCPLF